MAKHNDYKSPLPKGDEGGCKKLAKACPRETRPRKNWEWGKEIFTG